MESSALRNYAGEAAIITGGASGLGFATAKQLSKDGIKVAIFDLNEEAGRGAAEQLGGVFCKVDVTSTDDVEKGFAKARAAHGQERIFVNCAGKGSAMKTASRDRNTGQINHHDIAAFETIVNLNLVATFRCTAMASAGMMSLEPLSEGERGVITNTASIAAQEGQVGQVAYSAAKAGIAGMTLTIARDLAKEGIRINTILPGVFLTPPLERAPEKVVNGLKAATLFPKRLGAPEEFADLVATLIRNGYFNGQTIRLDGGTRMPPR